MSTNFVVTGLPAYVEENKDLLIKNFALVGGGTRSRMSIQTGVKYKENLNYLELTPVIQDGSDCGFDAQGAATLTDREIVCPALKVNMDICEKKLRGKWAEYLIRINATAETLPFEQYVMEGLTNEINKQIEKIIWQGNTSPAVTGLLATALADVPSGQQINNGGTSAYADILAVYNAIPEEVLDRGASIFVSPAQFRQFMQELVSANLYHYDPANAEPNEFMLPGSNAKVVRTQGLAGQTKILATFDANLVYGCDMEGDAEDIKVWFSDDDDVWKIKVLWNMGMQIAYPDMVVLGK